MRELQPLRHFESLPQGCPGAASGRAGVAMTGSVGQTSWSAAGVPVGLLGISTEYAQRVREDPRRPGGLPHRILVAIFAVFAVSLVSSQSIQYERPVQHAP